MAEDGVKIWPVILTVSSCNSVPFKGKLQ